MRKSSNTRKPESVLRRFALALPQVGELVHMGTPSFRVNGKIFAQLAEEEKVALLKLALEEQDALPAKRRDSATTFAHRYDVLPGSV